MKNVLFSKFKDSIVSILPITLIVLFLSVTFVKLDGHMILSFLFACVLLVVGMTLFTMGADTAMLPIGQHMGRYFSKKNKPVLTAIFCFILGVVITIAEPDLSVLANQVSSINTWVFILVVSIGVGLFLILSWLRIIFKWRFNVVISISYVIILLITIFLQSGVIPLSFDSGSVTTGPISVPFIMAFGIGLASSRGMNAQEDSFGLIGFASAGPILAVMLLMSCMGVNSASPVSTENLTFLQAIPIYLKDVAIIILPIGLLFAIFQCVVLKLPIQEIGRIVIGLFYTYFGIVVFLIAVNVGFLPVGKTIGEQIAQNHVGALIPVCTIIGFCMAMVEPAVQVLAKQIEEITGGSLKRTPIILCVAFGIAIALMLCAARILTGISILWILVPAYILCIALSFVVPKLFVGVAFDSGGVATGAIATTFALPMILGACSAVGSDILLTAFGTLALCAVAPILTVLSFGLIYKIGAIKRQHNQEQPDAVKRIEIIEYD